MRITSITIRNFKGFAAKTVELSDRLTVVIGNNTAGKTTLLKAIQVGLGAYLQCLKQLPGGALYRRNFSKTDEYLRFDPVQRDYLRNPDNPRIDVSAVFYIPNYGGELRFEEHPVRWYREYTGSGTTHTRACCGALMDVVSEIEQKRAGLDALGVLPLLLSFGAKRTSDAQAKMTSKVKERVGRLEKAYRFCLHDRVDFDGAMDWLKNYDKGMRDHRNFEGNREAFFEALQTAIPALSELDFDHGELEALVTVTGRDSERHHLSFMSDGLQAMINMVSEMAHRCIELNGCLGYNAVKMTPGIVMIDEIDLYLHPHWQKHVLQDLMRAFPMIQFVVSTHSPFIVQSLEENQLISFDNEVDTSGTPNMEGLEDIAANRLGLSDDLGIRSEKYKRMEEAAARLFEAADSNAANKDELRSQLISLEAEFSRDPAYLAFVRTEMKARGIEK